MQSNFFPFQEQSVRYISFSVNKTEFSYAGRDMSHVCHELKYVCVCVYIYIYVCLFVLFVYTCLCVSMFMQ
jgi:hypothetical protein